MLIFPKPAGILPTLSVLFALAASIVILLATVPEASAQADVPAAPADVALYTIQSQKLEVRWSSTDAASTTSFKIQWKSGSQEFDTSRQLISDPQASIVSEQSTSARDRYAETISGLTNGTAYTVRVIASNADGDSDPSAAASGTPQAALGDARLFIETEVIEWFESSHPWLRDTWDYMTRQNVPVTFQRTQGGSVEVDCSDRAIELRMRKCTASAVYIGRDEPRIIYIIVHELAHIHTLSNGVADTPGPLGVAMVYFYDLLTPAYLGLEDRELWQSGCAPHELYADALSLVTIGDSLREDLFYWKTCQLITDDLGDQALAIVKSATTGEMPSWFDDTYDDLEGDPDLADFWVDVKALRERHRASVIYQLRNAFGGYCNNWHATLSAFERGVTRNPWNDGGCVPAAPTDVSATAVGHGRLAVSWQGPLDDGGSPVEGYRVQWKSGTQQYSSSRRAVVTDLDDLQTTISGLSNGTSHTIRVLAYNHNGDGAGEEITATPTATDTSTPSLLYARLVPDSLSVHLTYNEALDETSVPVATAFALSVDGVSQTPEVGISGNVVTLDFLKVGGVTPQDVLTVSYTVPTGPTANPLKDSAGNSASGLSAQAVRNDSTSVVFTSDPGSDQTYSWNNGAGTQDVIEATVTFSEPVFVNGVPELEINIGDQAKYAAYQSGSGTSTLRFRYVLTEDETDDDGISVSAGAIEGMVRYVSSNAVAPALVQFKLWPGHRVDTVRPTMLYANIFADGNELKLRWNEALDQDRSLVQHGRGFQVHAFRDGVYLTITETSVQGNVVTLKLSTTVSATTRLTVAYFDSSIPIKDAAGNRAVWHIKAVSVIASSNSPAEFPAAENGTRNVDENTASGTNIGAPIAATDADNDGLTYSISGTDAAFFEIVDTSGQLRTQEPLDHESRATYTFEIAVHDSKDVYGNADTTVDDTISVTVTVNDVNEPPEVTGDTEITVDENTENFFRFYAASDPEGTASTFTWSLSGTDRGDFDIDSNTGELTFKNVPDHELPADSGGNNEYAITVVATDQGSLRGTLGVTVTVTNINEPPVVTAVGQSADTTFPENSTSTVGRFLANDPERESFAWSVSGADSGFFSIDGGYLDFIDPPNFEHEADANGDGVYETKVVATDGGGNAGELQVKVTVTDVNEPPTVTGDSDVSVDENTENFSRTYSASDPEGVTSSFVWSLSGTDGGDFNIDRNTGELTFRSIPNYESPADSNGNNEYLVTVRVSDGQYTGKLDVVITVADVNEKPTITGTEELSYPENSVHSVATYRATDPERGAIAWSLSGDDRGDFDISQTGVLTFASLPDFESPSDADRDNVYLVTVQARDDGFNTAALGVTVTVTNTTGPEEPTITTTSNPSPYRENGTGTVYTFRARDPQGRPVIWSLEGADAGDFSITSDGGVLTFASPPDFENPRDADRDNVYEITVVVTDDQGLVDRVHITVTVTNDAEGVEPTISTRSPPSTYQENRTSAVYTLRASDPQRQNITWTLDGDDARDFNLTRDSSGRGVLAFTSPPDFESPVDADRQNDYELTVIATDEDGHRDRLSFTVTVTDLNEGPEVISGGDGFTVQENRNWPGATFTASDPEGGTVTRWNLGGRDGGDFTISSDALLTFRNVPDYERPDDADRDNVYEVEIRPYDGRYYGSHHITVTTQDVSEINGPDTLVRPENTEGVLATYRATGQGDLSADPVWRLTGTDSGDFAISEQGELSFRSAPDHERPADSNRDNVYNFAVQASDGRYYDSHDVTVTVTPVNEPPTITTTSSSATALYQNENLTSRLYTYRATDPEGSATVTWLLGGVDARFFTIDDRGQFSFDENSPPDFEQPGDSGRDNVYDVTIQARDDGFKTASLPVTVTVREVNEGPEVTSGQSAFTISENQDLPGAVYSGFDPEGGSVTRWTVGGRDGGDFQISSDGVLTFRILPNYENPADSDRDNFYELAVRPYDGRYYGSFPVTVTINDVNEPPSITTTSTSATTMTHPENRTPRLYTYRATDPEGATIAWSLSGTDARYFAIDQQGQFYFSTTNPPDFEARAASGQAHVYEVTVQAGDGVHTASLPVAVTVTDVNEGPEVSGPSSFTISENQRLLGAVYTAIDPEGSYVTRWSAGGRDGSDFFITQGGTLYFRNLPDYEQPADSDRDNVYEVTIQPYDGRNTGSYAVTVTVTDVNEPPEFRSGSKTSFIQAENRTSRLYTFSATDPEGGEVDWSVSGTDGRHFTIDGQGQFSFDPNSPPDFDAPGDFGRNNLYDVTIQARDPENNTASLPVRVTVTEINEGPVITPQGSGPGSVLENSPTTQVLATYSARDPERPSVRITQWSTSGRDGGRFVMNALGELRFRYPPDYERPVDSNRDNVYELTIRASDGRNTSTLDEVQVITVTDVNERPTITTASRTEFSQQENSTSVLYTFRAVDPEGGTVTWTPAGPDGIHFTIDNRGAFAFRDPPDFDAPGDVGRDNVYHVTVEARDAEFKTARLEVAVTVTDHNEGVEPTISTRRPPTTYQENRTTTVYTFRASDPQRGTISWSLTGTDANDFDISESGALTFRIPPDFEGPADADRNNVYELAVVATDEEGYTDRVDFAITVTNHNEGVEPTISTRRPPTTFPENRTTTVYTFSAYDPQGQTIAWTLDGTDLGPFTITIDSSGRGALTFDNPPDFENPVDADRDNIYKLSVIATDTDGNRDRVHFTITVTDVNEGPEITLQGTAVTSVPENHPNTSVLARYVASDPENPGAGIFEWRTYGRDGADFVISHLGELRFRNSPDYERPADADRDNVYEVIVRASDGRVYTTMEEPLLVTVTEVNEAPVITTRSRTEFTWRENSTSVLYTYRAADPDLQDKIRWLVEGADGDDFAIHDGMLTFRRLPDLEAPVDADRDNVYEITVVAADNRGLRDTVPATITITDQTEGPVISGTTSFTVAENYDIAQGLGAYTATDAKDGRPVYPQWSLSGRDGGDFLIDRYSGVLTFRNTPDYDRPADADRDNVYEVTIRGHDSRAYGYLEVVVTVTNINESAPVVTGSATRTVQENNASTIYTYRATDADLGDTIAWSTGGDDGAHFVITTDSSGRGVLTFASPPDFESPADSDRNNIYSLDVVATDGAGLRGTLAVSVTVTALNEGPVVSGRSAFTIYENQDLIAAVYSASDPEAIGGGTTTITWSVAGRDAGDFTIDRETGVLTFRTLPDHEKPADSNGDNVYELTVRAYDGRAYGSLDVTVTVLEVNEGPKITGSDSLSFRENTLATTSLYTYRATDPEGDAFTWDLGGLDAGDFEITTDTSGRGVLTFASPPNFDNPADSNRDNAYVVTVQARDDRGNTGELPVLVTVTDQNEGAVVSGRTELEVQENYDPALVLATYFATDPEGQTITGWSLSGYDSGDFAISENGELTFRNTPDYDRPADSNGDNEYRITVRAYDGRTYGNLDVVITVSNLNEHDPVIRSGSRTSFSYQEEKDNTLYTYSATDQDKGDVITWSVGGSDGYLFRFNDRNGLEFREPPDYENPRDFGRDNEYSLIVVATDSGGRSTSLDVTVTITAVDEGPIISGTTEYTVLEGQELVGAFFTARDPEDPSIAVSNWRTAGTDGGDFTITQEGVLSFRNTPDYDQPADSNGDNVYLVTVQVSDGRYYGSLEVTVTVTDQNEAEPVVTGSTTRSFQENTPVTTRLYAYRVTDADRNTVFAWSLQGPDRNDFTISNVGELYFSSPPNHERPADANFDNVYEITVVASDGIYEGVLDVTVTVTDVNEGPEISGRDVLTVSENYDSVLATYFGVDPEDTTAEITRWSTAGRDGSDFTINSDGELSFRNPPNHEQPADSDQDNVYELTVRASDSRVYGNYDVVVTVEPVDEAPEFRSGNQVTFTYRENGTASLYTYRATDPEGAEVSWTVGGPDAGYFDISDTGLLTFEVPPDFENQARFDGSAFDNLYEITVVAGDQTGHADGLEVTVTITDVNEGPEITGCTETLLDTVLDVEFEDCDEIAVRENHDEPLYTYTARDPEDPTLEITRWSLAGRDGGDFTISEEGELSFRNPPDYEQPADSDRNSVYEVTVRPSDGRYLGSYNVTVTVEAVDEAPEFRSGSQATFSYRENGTAALYTYRATDPEGNDVTWGLSGPDSGAFAISQDGVLRFRNAPDYEEPSDLGRDNVYGVTVEARDGNGNTARLEVTVTVVNLTD